MTLQRSLLGCDVPDLDGCGWGAGARRAFAARRFNTACFGRESRVMLPSYPARAYPGRARIETFSTRVHSSTYQQISRLLLESEYTLDSVRYVNGGTLIDIEAHRVIA
jgi:hypothetical protein